MGAKGKIAAFCIVFCIIMAIPLAANAGSTTSGAAPSLDTPEINALSNKSCIESTEYMKSSHMQLLDSWRMQAVRGGATTYVSTSGVEYEMSMENTCFSCHSNPHEFCDSCHVYSSVSLYCWDCHEESAGNESSVG